MGLLKVVKNHSYDPGGLISFLYGKADAILMLIELIDALASLIFPIYVFVRLKKERAQKIPEIEAAP